MPAYLSNISYALGDITESVDECASAGRTVSSAALLRESGFQRHHICSGDSSAYSMAREAVSQIAPQLSNIGAIVYANTIPCNANAGSTDEFLRTRDVKHLMDFPASRLQSDFGLEGAQVFGLGQQACTGMIGSMRLASMMLAAEPEFEQVLCVTADRFPQGAIYEQSYNLISDGAAACLISATQGDFQLIAHHGVTNGAMSFASDDETVGSFFNYSVLTISATLDKAGLTAADINWVVPQNTSKNAWIILAKLLRMDPDRVYLPSLESVAHLISGDNMINLRMLNESGQLRSGDNILLFMAGYGLNWQCMILEKV